MSDQGKRRDPVVVEVGDRVEVLSGGTEYGLQHEGFVKTATDRETGLGLVVGYEEGMGGDVLRVRMDSGRGFIYLRHELRRTA